MSLFSDAVAKVFDFCLAKATFAQLEGYSALNAPLEEFIQIDDMLVPGRAVNNYIIDIDTGPIPEHVP